MASASMILLLTAAVALAADSPTQARLPDCRAVLAQLAAIPANRPNYGPGVAGEPTESEVVGLASEPFLTKAQIEFGSLDGEEMITSVEEWAAAVMFTKHKIANAKLAAVFAREFPPGAEGALRLATALVKRRIDDPSCEAPTYDRAIAMIARRSAAAGFPVSSADVAARCENLWGSRMAAAFGDSLKRRCGLDSKSCALLARPFFRFVCDPSAANSAALDTTGAGLLTFRNREERTAPFVEAVISAAHAFLPGGHHESWLSNADYLLVNEYDFSHEIAEYVDPVRKKITCVASEEQAREPSEKESGADE